MKMQPTHLSTHKSLSSPDLIIAGRNVTHLVKEYSVGDDIGSDHLPIICSLSFNSKSSHINTTKTYWKYRTIDKEKYNTMIRDRLTTWNRAWEEGNDNIDECYRQFCVILLNATKHSCQQKRFHHRSAPWINKSILKAIDKRNKLRKSIGASPTIAKTIKYIEARKEVKKLIKISKSVYWMQQYQKCDRDSVYKLFKRLNHKRNIATTVRNSLNSDQILNDDRAIADAICTLYKTKCHSNASSNNNNDNIDTTTETRIIDQSSTNILNATISAKEISDAIIKLRIPSAPGIDNIHTFMLKAGEETIIVHLKLLFNKI